VGGCVALVTWLDAQDVSLLLISGVIAAIAGVLIVTRGVLLGWASVVDGQAYDIISFTALVGINVVPELGLDENVGLLVLSTVVFAAVAGPLALDLYKADKASRKQCPDCCEWVKAEARVCRYCGYRWQVTVKPRTKARRIGRGAS
jgi:hypothetical protein